MVCVNNNNDSNNNNNDCNDNDNDNDNKNNKNDNYGKELLGQWQLYQWYINNTTN